MFIWILRDSVINSKDRFKISESNVADTNSYFFTSTLNIAPIIRKADEGVLTCRVYITPKGSNEHISDSLTINKSIILQIEGIVCSFILYKIAAVVIVYQHCYYAIVYYTMVYVVQYNAMVQYYLRN